MYVRRFPARCALAHAAQVRQTAIRVPFAGSLRGLVRQLSIDQFENESRRVSCDSSKVFPGAGAGADGTPATGSPMFERAVRSASRLLTAEGLLQHDSGLGSRRAHTQRKAIRSCSEAAARLLAVGLWPVPGDPVPGDPAGRLHLPSATRAPG